MSASSEPLLPFGAVEPAADPVGVTLDPADEAARRHAVDPSRNVVLEASAGTGKTRVLVDRYVNLLTAGVDPDHILAMTFTRKAATEMRDRVIERLREAGRLSPAGLARWRDLKDRLGDIAISTIDAFCLSLLREFPLEADVDPGFTMADETEAPRLIGEALDQALRICRAVARDDDDVALVFAQLGERRLRGGLAALMDRRLVAPRMLGRYLEKGPRNLSAAIACRTAAVRLSEVFAHVEGGVGAFLEDGPVHHPQFAMLAADIARLCEAKVRLKPDTTADEAKPDATDQASRAAQAAFRVLLDRLRAYFMTKDGRPREKAFTGTGFSGVHCASDAAWRRHRQAAAVLAPAVAESVRAFRRDLNVVLSRGVWRIFAVALEQYDRTLESRALLDFSGVLERAASLLAGMDEFAESRFRLEARYRHVLLDEFQDTSRAQWHLVAQLVRNWAEGLGAASDALPPTIFIVGDRKQSIYGFRDADVSLFDEAAAFIEGLRSDGSPRRTIAVSFRAAPAILSFINDLFDQVDKAPERPDQFRYAESDRFPVEEGQPDGQDDRVGIVTGETVGAAAEAVAAEVVRLLAGTTVRDRATGLARPAQAADVAVLFRSRDSHRDFERALSRAGVRTYVYKGLGFFDADEVQDAVALLRYLADPSSEIRAAAFLRSRIVRLSDVALANLAPAKTGTTIGPGLADAIRGSHDAIESLGREDRRALDLLRGAVPRWRAWVDRMSPAELLRRVLDETGYAYETRGPGRRQARENLKKLASMIRRFHNRGYATLGRVAEHLDRLAVGDESNASIDARDAVSLMTVHAAKGLEFPIVFVVNMGRGTGGFRPPIRIASDPRGEASVSIADFQSEADEDAQGREREETKRLLYVALTRARDRLYLSATVRDGVCRTGRGSLGEVLPATFTALIGAAAGTESGGLVTWRAANGRTHEIKTGSGIFSD